jgi:hypothetical protein
MAGLLDAALAESKSPYDQFIFLSAENIPVKPFYDIYHNLCAVKAMSSLCVCPSNQWLVQDSSNILYAMKGHQWIILSKSDAIKSVKVYKAHPTWESLFLKVPHCSEEYFFLAAIFGFYNKTEAAYNNFEHPYELEQSVCRTYVWWPDYPVNSQFLTVAPPLSEKNTRGNQRIYSMPLEFLANMRQSQFFFVRKVNSADTKVIRSNGTEISLLAAIKETRLYSHRERFAFGQPTFA